MTELIIPMGKCSNEFSIIANAGNYMVTFPTFLEFVRKISGREIYEVNDNWNGTLEELRKANKGTLIEKIKKYLPFRRKQNENITSI